MKAMLFAAGLGTRLKPFTDYHPKALAQINGKTLLEHNISYLQRFNIYDVVVNVHHFANQIIEVVNTNQGFGSNIIISDETEEVLETGGGLKKAQKYFANEPSLVVMNVDILTNLDLNNMLNEHDINNSIATLAVMQRTGSRQLLFNNQMRLCGWENNKTDERRISHPDNPLTPYAFSGVQIIDTSILQDCPFEGKFSIIDLYLHVAKTRVIKGFNHTGDILIDAGTPEKLEYAGTLFK